MVERVLDRVVLAAGVRADSIVNSAQKQVTFEVLAIANVQFSLKTSSPLVEYTQRLSMENPSSFANL